MAFVYFIRSKKDNRIYIGSTIDIKQRLLHHFGHHTPTTKRFGENLELVLCQEYDTLSDARSVERKLKRLKRKDYIEKIVKDGSIKIRP